MAQPGVKPYFSPGMAVYVLNKDRDKTASGSAITAATTATNGDRATDLTKWLKGLNYVQEANIGDSTAVGDRSMGKSTGKPDNGTLDIEIMRSYSAAGPMTVLQNYVSYPAIVVWTDDVGDSSALKSKITDTDETYRFAVCYITGIVHTDANVQNADASSMSMSWPIDGDVYKIKTGKSLGFTTTSGTPVYNDPRTTGVTEALLSGGTTSSSGTGATFNIVTGTSGAITSATVVSGGSGFVANETITFDAPNSGTDAVFTVNTVTNGAVATFTITNAGTNFVGTWTEFNISQLVVKDVLWNTDDQTWSDWFLDSCEPLGG